MLGEFETMRGTKNTTEGYILAVAFSVLAGLLIVFMLCDKELYLRIAALASAVLSGKSAGLLFCRSFGLINGHTMYAISYKAIAFLVVPLAVLAALLRIFS